MRRKIFIGLVLLLFGLTFVVAGGVLGAKRTRVPLVLPVDGAQPPGEYVGPTPVVYEGANQPNCEDINSQAVVLEIEQWAMTYYDYQQNGSMGRMIAVGPGGHKNMICHETRGPYGTQYPKYITYNCKDPLNNWLNPGFGVKIDGGTNINAGYANIGVLHDGRAVIIYHRNMGTPIWYTSLIVQDTGHICSGYFGNKYDLPDWLQHTAEGEWPKMGIVYDATVDTDYIHIVMTEWKPACNDQRLGYIRCHFIRGDALLCETPTGQSGVISPVKVVPNTPGCGSFCPVAYFGEVEAPGVPPGKYPYTISAVVATSLSQKVAVVFTNRRESSDIQVNNDVYYFESTNNGIEWFPQSGGTWPPTQANGMIHNITNYPTNAMERAFTDVAACYDYNDNLHIIWNGCYWDSIAGWATYDANLYHWSQATGISLIASGYWGGTDPGGYNRNIAKMSISATQPIYHPDSVYLFCTWTQFDSGDISLGGYSNGDIYGSVSRDSGRTWVPAYNLTNTKTPNCAPGECMSEHWSSMADNMYGGDLHIEYVCDRDAGGVIEEGTWTDNPMMYLHVQQLSWTQQCGVSITLLDPPRSWTDPPIKVLPGQQRTIAMELEGLYTFGGEYQVTTDNLNVSPHNASGTIPPGQKKRVWIDITCSGQESFLDVNVFVNVCRGTAQETTYVVKLYVVQSPDYYECHRDSATFITKDNGTLKLWACVNTSQELWDKRIQPENKQKVIFSGGVIVATTTADGDTIVGRQDCKDTKTGARDTINVVQGYDYYETNCNIQKIHVENTYIWYPLPPPQTPTWYWIDIYKQIIMFHDRPGYPPCPDWKKEQVIKYVWIKWGRPPVWWPNPGSYSAHEDIYWGVFADIDAPFDTGCFACNTAGYDYARQMVWQHGYSTGQHPEYENHYIGLALTNTSGEVVAPFGCQDVLSEDYLYPQGGWGWKDGELYQLAATSGVNIHHPDSVADRTVVLTANMIPAGPDSAFQSEFILIKASIPTGLADLQVHIDSTRAKLIPELNLLGLFNKKFPICGDITSDGVVNSADIVALINYQFLPGGPLPNWPLNRADVNGDGYVNSADIVYLINYQFVPGSPAPKCSDFGRE